MSSPEKKDAQVLVRQVEAFADTSFTRNLLDTLPATLLILNDAYQIVYASRTVAELLGASGPESLMGRRLGDVLGCVNALQAPGGCSTGEVCNSCKALFAIIEGLEGRQCISDCELLCSIDAETRAAYLRVCSTPLNYQGESFTVLSITDISGEKRRKALERVFFHDIINVVGSIKGFSDLLKSCAVESSEEIFSLIQDASVQVLEEIDAQRTLLAAENNELVPRNEPLGSLLVLQAVAGIYSRHDVARDKTLAVDEAAQDMIFTSDRSLVQRVLGNMVKNALEASRPGDRVTLGCQATAEGLEFTVHNSGEIPLEVRQQIFRRSFSTKGAGRGLGTYSMLLLSEYLGGKVGFSTAEEGTCFFARFPLAPPR